MPIYDLHFNKDNSTIRNIIIGVIATLNDKIYWYNWVNNEKVKVSVPFYFSTTGDERFLQDMFLNDITYDTEGQYAETPYNLIPRGVINTTSTNIESGSLVNKYVRGEYEKQMEDGTLKRYSAEFMMVPINMSFEATILLDSMLDQLKATEAIISILYKNNVFYIVDSQGIKIPGTVSLSEDYSQERAIEYSFTDKKEWKLTFSIECQSFIPVLKNQDNQTEIFAGSRMEYFDFGHLIVGENIEHWYHLGPTGATQFIPRDDTKEPWINRILNDKGCTATFIGHTPLHAGLNRNFYNYDGKPFSATGPWPIGLTGGSSIPYVGTQS